MDISVFRAKTVLFKMEHALDRCTFTDNVFDAKVAGTKAAWIIKELIVGLQPDQQVIVFPAWFAYTGAWLAFLINRLMSGLIDRVPWHDHAELVDFLEGELLPVLASLHERFTTMLANGQVNSHRFYTVRALLLHLSEGCCLLYFIRDRTAVPPAVLGHLNLFPPQLRLLPPHEDAQQAAFDAQFPRIQPAADEAHLAV